MMNRSLDRRLAKLEQARVLETGPKLWTTIATSEAEAEALRQAAIASGEIDEDTPHQFIVLVQGS